MDYDIQCTVRCGSASSIIWLPNLHDLFLLTLVHTHIRAPYLILPSSLHMKMCSWAHTCYYVSMYCSFANIGHANMMCSTASSNCLQSLHLLLVLLLLLLFLWHFNAHVKSHNQAYTCRKSPPHPPLWHHSLPVVSIMTSADERWGETCVDTMY